MMMILGKPAPLLFGQLLLGIINGSFYAMLSLGLAIIFGLLNVINFAHGALFMVGAFVTWGLLHYLGIGFWPALVVAPVMVGAFGLLIERTLIRFTYKLDILYGLLLTFGLALVLEGIFTNAFGSSGVSYDGPNILSGTLNLGFMYLPVYRAFVVFAAIVICFGVWFTIEKTPLGALLRAATENPALVQSFGVNVPRLISLTFAGGVALAGLAGVLAAPLYSVNPGMGTSLINTVFAVVVIGGMGSIGGAILTGFGLGIIQGFTEVFYPAASSVVVFAVMAVVLLARPAGLFGRVA
ncbi:MAG: branched-chain amino acid ABC transporter permease [Acidiphilium sp. 37-64-53]|uniref:branched-chain amino acid ABC transporter permease n=1 Tax=Acidiphilium TaxID=522 RepID=UPI000BD5BB05|nr:MULTISPECIES: branched-chain amino acid ABC transporter permease [Acidiphilium]OYW03468.1 MAG: branched-chain amino acid ABC transporter permease [Acidiphilium sp. 37-64-53]OZB30664.1 MAG: branched-chain amino acid ABC transporter permease [Acidiphilium sp. 34-64-41]HQT84804.1 branched-chain amino acid ABC transporter permease [Acidiphilium rubrum]